MKTEKITSPIIKDSYYKIEHPTGLTIYVYPKEDYVSSYAIFGTKFGSVNIEFLTDNGEKTEVPQGIAHYLEHKLFESEDGDAFSRFAATGAYSNAYTSFDRTCYLFSCSDKFSENLEILLDFVQSPYFTPETVLKEQGIIGQEIKMYDDDPNWRVMFNLLRSMYKDHPLKYDIAGTVESIAEITDKKLYTCYESFYNLHNMVLVAVGNVNIDDVIKVADKVLKNCPEMNAKAIFPEEALGVVEHYHEEKSCVSIPLFQLGYKEDLKSEGLNEKDIAASDVILSVLFSESSELYSKLINQELINNSFSFEHFEGDGFSSVLIGGESPNPEKTAEIINDEIGRLLRDGIDKDRFEISKRSVYGDGIASFNNIEGIGNIVATMHFAGREVFKYTQELSNLTLEDVQKRFKEQFKVENYSLSVIKPAQNS